MAQSTTAFVSRYGPWALVTGASSGIGREIAKILGEKGLNLVLTARNRNALTVLSDELATSFGVDVEIAPADLQTQDGVATVLNAIADKDVGLYIGNAGFGTAGHFSQNDIQTELDMIDLNCRSLTALAHPLAIQMKKRDKGGIILMSSIVAFQGVANSAVYAATKAYVQVLAEGLHAELKGSGIDVLASAPGPVATGFSKRADMSMSGAASPDAIARATVNALGKMRTTRPGFQSKLLGYGLSTLPRRFRTLILSGVMGGMIQHRHGNGET